MESRGRTEVKEKRESRVFLQLLTKVILVSLVYQETLDPQVTREQLVSLEMTEKMETPDRLEAQVPRERPETTGKRAHRVQKATRVQLEFPVFLDKMVILVVKVLRATKESQEQKGYLVRLYLEKMGMTEVKARKVNRGLQVLQELLDKWEPKETKVPMVMQAEMVMKVNKEKLAPQAKTEIADPKDPKE